MRVTTGIDIIEVDRIKESIEELGENFLNRIYTEKEIEYCNKSGSVKYQHFAARFATKEAVFKAISQFISGREEALWKDIEVINIDGGKPVINVDKLQKNFKKNVDNIELKSIDISISHIKEYAVASVVAIFDN